jgi:hypothetical protein
MKKLIFLASIGVLISVAAFRDLHAPAVRAAQFDRTQPQAQSPAEQEMRDRQAREANKKRQDDIRNDTEKLFQLAGELKAAVDKSNEHLLSLEVVRKADEVEKLAKKVKEKMRDSIGSPLQPGPPPVIKLPQP